MAVSVASESDESNDKGKNNTGKTGLLARLDRLIDRIQLTIIIATCFMTVTAVVITIVVVSQAPEDNSSQMLFRELCIDCAQLTRNPSIQEEVSGFSRRQENGSEMCCAETPEQISALLQASTREQVTDSDMLAVMKLPRLDGNGESQCWRGTLPEPLSIVTSSRAKQKNPEPQDNDLLVSAHKQLLPVDNNESLLKEPRYVGNDEHFPAKFNTIYNDPVTEHVQGVEVLDAAFRINYTGLYYVYLSVHIDPVFNTTLDPQEKHCWTQYLNRECKNNPAKTGNLLQGAYNAKDESTDHEESVYIAGTFHLDKGDELQVCLNPIGVFSYISQSSFLGVVLLNSGPL